MNLASTLFQYINDVQQANRLTYLIVFKSNHFLNI